MTCEHNWQYQGVVFSSGRQLPGSGAHEWVYEDRYYCTKCLEVVDKYVRRLGDTYSKTIEGSMPK